MNGNSKNIVRTIAEVGIFAAIGFVLDEIQGIAFGSVFTAGGSIGIAMVAVLIIAYRRGWLPAICTGLIMGAMDLITKAYIITFWQVLLDYILPYSLVGCAGFFKYWFDKSENHKTKIIFLCVGAIVGGLLKFLSHFIVGMLVWAPMGYEWNIESEALYSFAYNIAFVGPSIILSAAVLIVLYKRAPRILCVPIEEVKTQKHIIAFDYVINPTLALTGLFLFVYFLAKYISISKLEDQSWAFVYYSNQDAVFLMFTGLLLLFVFGICVIKTLSHRQNNRLTTILFIIILLTQVIYALSKILACYFDKWQEPDIYFVWLVVSTILTFIALGLYFLVKQILVEDKSDGNSISTN